MIPTQVQQPHNQQQAGPSEPRSSSSEKVVVKRRKWDEKQTMCLVQAWSEKLEKIESPRATEAWKEVKIEVDKMGPPRTVDQIKQKIRALRENFRNSKANNGGTGAGPDFPGYYTIMDNVIGEREATVPNLVQVGQQVDQVDEQESENEEPTAILANPPTPDAPSNAPLQEPRKKRSLDHFENLPSEAEVVQDVLKRMEENGELEKPTEEIEPKKENSGKSKAKDNKPPKPKKLKLSDFQREVLSLQQSQIDTMRENEIKQQQAMIELFEKQQEAEKNERERDREFFLELGKLFANSDKK